MSLILQIPIVISLTLLTSCALLSLSSDPYENDPIARAVFSDRRPASEPKDSIQSREPVENEYEIQEAIQAGELVLGMKMKDVLSIWGQPRNIEVAGEPGLGHQRWVYTDGLLDHLKLRESRIVYFEAGRVVGWENGI